MKKERTEFVYKAVESLIPYARNARTHSEEQITQIASSIKEFGFINPVIVSADGGVIAGHGRIMAAKKLGLEIVPCIVESHLTEAQKKAYILADNKLALNAGWDEELLRLELEDLKDLDFDLSLTGFEFEEIDLLLDEPKAKSEADTTPTDLDAASVDDLRLDKRMKDAKYVFFSFSGGRDSTRALYLCARKFMATGKHCEAIYVESPCEFPDVVMHVRRVCDELGLTLTRLSPAENYVDAYANKGNIPNPLFMDCVQRLINKPMDDYIESIVQGEDYILVRGGQAKQKTSKSKTAEVQTVKDTPNKIIYNPLFTATQEQLSTPIPEWRGYAAGFLRTACWCCPFQRREQYIALKKNYPLLYEEMKAIVRKTKFKHIEGDGHMKYYYYWQDEEDIRLQWDR